MTIPTASIFRSYLRQELNNFELRANFMNKQFMAVIANATCGVLSQMDPVPPTIADASTHVSGQAQAAVDVYNWHVHGLAQQERDEAWMMYQNARNNQAIFAISEGGARVERERYLAARRAYEDASRAVGVQPTRTSSNTTNTTTTTTTTTTTSGSGDQDGEVRPEDNKIH